MSKRVLTAILLSTTIFCLLSTLSYAQESITITTYYPSPYGSYNVLRSNYLQAGVDGLNYDYIRFSKASGNPSLSGNFVAGFMWNENDAVYGNGDDFVIYTYDDRDMVLRSGTGQVHILSGNVGIGTTSPGYRLDVAGTTRVKSDTLSGDALIVGNDSKLVDVDSQNTLGIYGIQDSTKANIKLGSAGPIISGVRGNVGIGTTNPGSNALNVTTSDLNNAYAIFGKSMVDPNTPSAYIETGGVMGVTHDVSAIGKLGTAWKDGGNVLKMAVSGYTPSKRGRFYFLTFLGLPDF